MSSIVRDLITKPVNDSLKWFQNIQQWEIYYESIPLSTCLQDQLIQFSSNVQVIGTAPWYNQQWSILLAGLIFYQIWIGPGNNGKLTNKFLNNCQNLNSLDEGTILKWIWQVLDLMLDLNLEFFAKEDRCEQDFWELNNGSKIFSICHTLISLHRILYQIQKN